MLIRESQSLPIPLWRRLKACHFNKSNEQTKKTIIGGSCHKYHFCREKKIVATNTCLSRQRPVSRDKHVFVATKVCSSRQKFSRDKQLLIRESQSLPIPLWRRLKACHFNKSNEQTKKTIIGGSCHKYHFCEKKIVATNTCLSRQRPVSRDKHVFVATKVCSSRQKFSRDKQFCRDKSIVATSILLSQQKTCFVVTKCLSRQKWYLWQFPPVIQGEESEHH